MASLRKLLLPPPPGDWWQYSMISPEVAGAQEGADDLVDLLLQCGQVARQLNLSDISERMATSPRWPDIWPGEHYKLLAALALVVKPMLVVEIGTYTGLSALTWLKYMPADCRLVTFDIIPWQKIAGTCLRLEDFASGRMTQILGDLADPQVFNQHLAVLAKADIVFVDGPKDGRFEYCFWENLRRLPLGSTPLVVLDDIRFFNMLRLWTSIRLPKLDATSLGHWSGTGLVRWGPVTYLPP